MATIGKFTMMGDSYEGLISTLTMSCEASFVPNKNKKHEDSPDYFIKLGECDLGFARNAVAQGEDGKPYLTVFFYDPSFAAPIWAAMFDEDGQAVLVWSRSNLKHPLSFVGALDQCANTYALFSSRNKTFEKPHCSCGRDCLPW